MVQLLTRGYGNDFTSNEDGNNNGANHGFHLLTQVVEGQ